MFYSQIILAKKGPLGKIWLAAHWDKKLNKGQIFQTDIQTSVESIVNPQVPLALRVSGHLLLGIVTIYSRKVRYLFSDCSEALVKIKMAFRPGVVDLPQNAQEAPEATINVQNFGEFDVDMSYSIDTLPEPDQWMTLSSQKTLARRQDITLTDPTQEMERDEEMDSFGNAGAQSTVDDSFGGGNWTEFDPEAQQEDVHETTQVSDIELGRDADTSALNITASIVDPLDGPNEDGDTFGGENMKFDDSIDMSFPTFEQEPSRNDPDSAIATIEEAKSSVSDEDALNRSTMILEPAPSPAMTEKNLSRISMEFGTPDIGLKIKKKRKLALDNSTELSSKFIKKSLEDTSDITNEWQPLAERTKSYLWEEDATTLDYTFKTPATKCLGDALKYVFKVTMTSGKLPFSTTTNVPSEEVEEVEEARHENVEEQMEIEENLAEGMVEDVSCTMDLSMDQPVIETLPQDEEEPSFQRDETLSEIAPEELDAIDAPDDFNLASVNDIQGNIIGGNEISLDSMQHKWHPHTIKVMKLLRKSLNGQDTTSYNDLNKSKNSRRTAAAFFFELLQLKTLDYIDIGQKEAYGNITISKTQRFQERIPAVDG